MKLAGRLYRSFGPQRTRTSGWQSGESFILISRFGTSAIYLAVPPPPSVYWNHHVREKTRNNLLESTACGQNLRNEGLSFALLDWPHLLRDYHRLLGLWKARLDVTEGFKLRFLAQG